MEEDQLADNTQHVQDANMNITSTQQEAQSHETLYLIRSLNGQETLIPVIRSPSQLAYMTGELPAVAYSEAPYQPTPVLQGP